MIQYYRGENFPLQTTQERVLMALSCHFVDDVVIGAPHIITDDMMTSLNITTVIHVDTHDDLVLEQYAHIDPYEVPKAQGKYVYLERDPHELTVLEIAKRVRKNKEFYELKVMKKTKSESSYNENKVFV